MFWVLVVVSVVLACIPTLWTELDLLTAKQFTGPGDPITATSWWWVLGINLYVPAVFRGATFFALVLWVAVSVGRNGRQWRLPLAFFVLAGALGPGLVVNAGFKDHWQRARPYQVEHFGGTQQFTRAGVITDQCNNNCSFVSGHVACGFFLASLALVMRRKMLWLAIGTLCGLLVGFARIADSAHWLSDVLWACPITLMTSWLVWKLLLRAYPTPHEPSGTATAAPTPSSDGY
jgi:lipid A 4'-phosphatase